ncbi:MAG: VWA domain-containing protein, partial [Candidatus Sumerlaeaceae bacterium]|nr:VWA domain-containing protein [Candidatus Sumerlaeaceae bacterium]
MILLLFTCWLLVAGGHAQQASAEDHAVAFILVVDKSGSMLRRTSSGKTRWQEQKERMIGFARKGIPLGSRVTVIQFSSPEQTTTETKVMNTPADLESFVASISEYRDPVNNAPTFLYDTLANAFLEAEQLSVELPGRIVQVMLYSDGEDEKSAAWDLDAIRERFSQLVDRHKSIWLFQTPIEGVKLPFDEGQKNVVTGDPFVPLPVLLEPASVILRNLAANPEQEFQIRTRIAAGAEEVLRGKRVGLMVTRPDGSPLPISLVPPELDLISASTTITVRAEPGRFDPGQEVRGSLRFNYPTLSGYILHGPQTIDFVAQKQEPPAIFDLRPTDGEVVPARKEIMFLVSTVQGASVIWDLGDGETATGAEVRHKYLTPGPRQVRVKVTSDPRLGATERSIRLNVVDVGVTLDPVPPGVTVGQPVVLKASGRGGIRRYEWLVAGRVYDGRPRDDGREGTMIEIPFERSGANPVQVRGYSDKIEVASEEVLVQVAPAPRAAILAPQDRAVVVLGEDFECRAAVEGPVTDVEWVISSAEGETTKELQRIKTPVVSEGNRSVAVMQYRIAEATGVRSAQIRARTVATASSVPAVRSE